MNRIQKLHILIGDDDTPFAIRFAESLRRYHCICSVVHQSAPNMVRFILAEQPDAIILDISKGSLLHYDLLRSIRKCTNAPVFAVTAAYQQALDAELCRAGIVSIRRKPAEISAMLHDIIHCIYNVHTYPQYRSAAIHAVVTEFTEQLGAPQNLSGSRYLCAILCRTVENPALIQGICSRLYPQIAEEYHVKVPCIERNIRTLLEYIWAHSDRDTIARLLRYPTALPHKRMPNAKFIDYATKALGKDCRVNFFLAE